MSLIIKGMKLSKHAAVDGEKDTAYKCVILAHPDNSVELVIDIKFASAYDNGHLKYARVIAIYIDASGGMFDLDITTNIETVTGYEHFINKDYTFEDIGRRLFLTREAAEQALKERE